MISYISRGKIPFRLYSVTCRCIALRLCRLPAMHVCKSCRTQAKQKLFLVLQIIEQRRFQFMPCIHRSRFIANSNGNLFVMCKPHSHIPNLLPSTVNIGLPVQGSLFLLWFDFIVYLYLAFRVACLIISQHT